MNITNRSMTGPAALLAALAITNAVSAQIGSAGFAIDGTLDSQADGLLNLIDEEYGPALVTQISSVIDGVSMLDVSIGASLNNSNIGGVGAYNAQISGPTGPADVTTGFEAAFDLAELNWDGSSPVQMTIFVNGNGHSFISNQLTGFGGSANVGEPRVANFSSESDFPGDQFVTVSSFVSMDAATVDGVLDPAETGYGAPLWVAQNTTGFGDSQGVSVDDDSDPMTPNINVPSEVQSTGSEIDAVYAYIDDQGTPGDTDDDVLHVFVAGNLETNFNHLEMFFNTQQLLSGGLDTIGQRTVLAENPDVGFGALQRMAAFEGGEEPGLTFDDEFGADYYFVASGGNVNNQGTPNDVSDDTSELFSDAVVLATGGDTESPAGFVGSANLPGIFDGTGPNGAGISYTFNHSNVDGIFGGVVDGVDVANASDPSLVDTGMEFRVDLNELGWDGSSQVTVSGLFADSSGLQISNQVIGGLPANSAPLGFARDIDLSTIAGDQFIVAANSGSAPAAIDGTRDAQYPAPQYVNDNADGMGGPGNSTTLGDNANSDLALGGGSEINNASAYISSDGFLNVHVGGNASGFSKFLMFVDIDGESSGQNRLRGDNFDAGGFLADLGDLFATGEGLAFDTGVAPDLAVFYNAGDDGMQVAQFIDAASIPAVGEDDPNPSVGGQVPDMGNNAVLDGMGMPQELFGEGQAPFGFRDNNLSGSFGPNQQFDANGSELNQLYAHVGTLGDFGTTEYLFLMFTGNLEDNFNRLTIFLDTDPLEGQNVILPGNEPEETANPDINFGALQRFGGMIDPDTQEIDPPGLTFDENQVTGQAFSATHVILLNAGNAREEDVTLPGDVSETTVTTGDVFGDFAVLAGVTTPLPADQAARFLGNVVAGTEDLFAPMPVLSNGDPSNGDNGVSEAFQFNINNLNTGGVEGAPDQFGDVSDAPNVTTGIEIAIPLADLAPWEPFTDDGMGNLTANPIKIFAMITESGNGFVSNQTLPGVCSLDLGEVSTLNFNDYEGDQFVVLEYDVMALDGSFMVANSATLPMACEQDNGVEGDANGDGMVTIADVLFIIARFGDPAPSDADVNGDGMVTIADVLFTIARFGN